MRNPRQIDQPLVDAYLARRALDYLVGFTLSPVLWRKLPGSALGRPRAVGGAAHRLRPRESRSSASSARNTGRRSHDARRTPQRSTFEARLTELDGRSCRSSTLPDEEAAGHQGAAVKLGPSRRLGRGQAGEAQPAAAVHHLDAAAGSRAQARLLGQPHDAGRAAPL
jgi:DNA topoisomerase-1